MTTEAKTPVTPAQKAPTQTAVATKQPTEVAIKQSSITDDVLHKVIQMQSVGELKLPSDFSPENALKSAFLILQEQVDKDKKPVLESCSRTSIANTLLKMTVLGLNPLKKQVDFIAYGGKLTLQIEYHGIMMLAKRYGGVKDIKANVIYENDEFDFGISPETGKRVITKHVQKLENIDINKIKGAYAVVTTNDGTTDVEVMTMQQIRTSWEQGSTNGASPAHKKFTDQMAIKTVINRALKLYISSSNDSVLYLNVDDDNTSQEIRKEARNEVKQQMENRQTIDIQEATVINDEPKQKENAISMEQALNPKEEATESKNNNELKFS